MCKEAFRELASDLSSEVIWEARRKGYTTQMLALKVGKEKKTLYNISSDPSKYLSLPAFLGILITAQAKETVKKLAELVGLVAVEPPEPSDVCHYGKILKETGEAVASLSKAIEDGKIDEEEAREVIREAKEMLAVWFAKLHELEKIAGERR